MYFWVILSALIFLVSFSIFFQVVVGSLKMKSLDNVPVDVSRAFPLISIIVPACNEEKTLEPAVRSLLGLEYPDFEIIVIDDRSTDGTLAVLQQLALEFPELNVSSITALPSGWLGKNHALWWGAQQAQGDILLFTDADIVMERTTLSRAVKYLLEEKLDHLSLIFRNIASGNLLNAMIVEAFGGLFFLLRPWNVRKSTSRDFIGIGAFNMILSDSYWKFGGHVSFKMHPIDDVMLGKKVKLQGLSQDCLLGGSFVQVRWYEGIADMIQGLMKNVFALYGYRLSYVGAGMSGIILLTILPIWGVFFAQGVSRNFFILTVLSRFALFVNNTQLLHVGKLTWAWFLVTPYLTLFIIIKAVWITLRNRGIDWRGTRYTLQDLQKQEPLYQLSDFLRF